MPAPGLIFVGGGKGKKAAIKEELVISTASYNMQIYSFMLSRSLSRHDFYHLSVAVGRRV